MQKRGILGFDFDDVLVDFYGAFCNFHNEQYETSLTRNDIHSFYIEDILGCGSEETMKRVWDFYHSPIHNTMVPIEGAKKTLEYLQHNYDLYVVTARPDQIREKTKHLLNVHFPNIFKEIYFTNHHFSGIEEKTTKAKICKQLGVVFFMDDAPHHAEDVATVAENVFLFNTPWNRKHFISEKNIQRVDSWKDVFNFFLNKDK